jgi:hypothetical protein
MVEQLSAASVTDQRRWPLRGWAAVEPSGGSCRCWALSRLYSSAVALPHLCAARRCCDPARQGLLRVRARGFLRHLGVFHQSPRSASATPLTTGPPCRRAYATSKLQLIMLAAALQRSLDRWVPPPPC